MELDIDYERAGILHKGQKATLTTYIKEMYPGMQKPFHRPMVLICPGAAMNIIRRGKGKRLQ